MRLARTSFQSSHSLCLSLNPHPTICWTIGIWIEEQKKNATNTHTHHFMAGSLNSRLNVLYAATSQPRQSCKNSINPTKPLTYPYRIVCSIDAGAITHKFECAITLDESLSPSSGLRQVFCDCVCLRVRSGKSWCSSLTSFSILHTGYEGDSHIRRGAHLSLSRLKAADEVQPNDGWLGRICVWGSGVRNLVDWSEHRTEHCALGTHSTRWLSSYTYRVVLYRIYHTSQYKQPCCHDIN